MKKFETFRKDFNLIMYEEALNEGNLKTAAEYLNKLKYKDDCIVVNLAIIYSNYEFVMKVFNLGFKLCDTDYQILSTMKDSIDNKIKLYDFFKKKIKFTNKENICNLEYKLFKHILNDVELSEKDIEQNIISATIWCNMKQIKYLYSKYDIGVDIKDDKHLVEYMLPEQALSDEERNEYHELIEFYIKKGIDINKLSNKKEEWELSLLSQELNYLKKKTIKLLIENDFKFNRLILSYSNDYDMLKLFIKKGYDLNYMDGESLLQKSLKKCNKKISNLLIDNGANINAHKWEYKSPLYQASRNCDTEYYLELLYKIIDDIDDDDFVSSFNNVYLDVKEKFPQKFKKLVKKKDKIDLKETKKLINNRISLIYKLYLMVINNNSKDNIQLFIKHVNITDKIDDKYIYDKLDKKNSNRFIEMFPEEYKKYKKYLLKNKYKI